jgi:sulfonate transport system permease protein
VKGRLARRRIWRGSWLPLLLLAVWEGVARAKLVSGYLLPSFTEVLIALGRMGADGTLVPHLLASVGRVLAGFVLGAVIGCALGLVTGLSARAEGHLDPILQALRSIPALAWVPLLLLWMGIGEAPKVTLIAIGSFFPIYLNFFSGIRNVDGKWIELGRGYGFGRWLLVSRIVLPGALPALLTGLRTGIGVAWLYVVAAELMAAHSGLGFLLTDGRELSRADLVFASILLLALCGKLSDGALKALERRLLVWRPVVVAGS